jgi:hypothetical protein
MAEAAWWRVRGGGVDARLKRDADQKMLLK